MKIFVTGGAGFIASHIVDTYIQHGHQVVVADSLWHGYKKNLHPKAKLYQVDIRDLAKLRRILKREKPDIINHHAAIAEVVQSVRDPLPTLAVNVQGTVNVLLAGGEIGIKKFIFASTGGAIYGATTQLPTSEKITPAPLSPYGLSKLLGENCVQYYARTFGFSYLIFRYPNVYGPRQDPHGEAGVVAIFIEQMRQQHRPTIFGDGTKTRDYVYVADIVRANLAALRRGREVIINLGCGQEVTDRTVYQTLHRHFPKAPQASYKPVRSGEVIRSCLRANLANHILGWKPQWDFSAGVNDYIHHLGYDA